VGGAIDQRAAYRDRMSERKAVIDRYFEGFRRSDHAQILECLTNDIVWDLPGFTHLEGKDAFDSEIENEGFVGSPALDVDRVIEEDDTVVAIGIGSGTQTNGDVFEFAFCTVFTFAALLIRRVESFIVPLKSAAER
jgi:ketosteroid isomerase-like protein